MQILDIEYEADRNKYEDDGGYVLVVDGEKDFEEIKNKAYIDCIDVIAEYVDKIVCSSGETYTNSLMKYLIPQLCWGE